GKDYPGARGAVPSPVRAAAQNLQPQGGQAQESGAEIRKRPRGWARQMLAVMTALARRDQILTKCHGPHHAAASQHLPMPHKTGRAASTPVQHPVRWSKDALTKARADCFVLRCTGANPPAHRWKQDEIQNRRE